MKLINILTLTLAAALFTGCGSTPFKKNTSAVPGGAKVPAAKASPKVQKVAPGASVPAAQAQGPIVIGKHGKNNDSYSVMFVNHAEDAKVLLNHGEAEFSLKAGETKVVLVDRSNKSLLYYVQTAGGDSTMVVGFESGERYYGVEIEKAAGKK